MQSFCKERKFYLATFTGTCGSFRNMDGKSFQTHLKLGNLKCLIEVDYVYVSYTLILKICKTGPGPTSVQEQMKSQLVNFSTVLRALPQKSLQSRLTLGFLEGCSAASALRRAGWPPGHPGHCCSGSVLAGSGWWSEVWKDSSSSVRSGCSCLICKKKGDLKETFPSHTPRPPRSYVSNAEKAQHY